MSDDRYCVFGNPVAHSRSPRIHALFAEQCGQAMTYEAIEAPREDFAGAWHAGPAVSSLFATATNGSKTQGIQMLFAQLVRNWQLFDPGNVVLQQGFRPKSSKHRKCLFSNGFRAFPEGALGKRPDLAGYAIVFAATGL